MALTDKLTAIGNAIRSKTEGNSLLTLSQMSNTISGLVVPASPVTYNQMNTQIANFINNVTYSSSDYTTNNILNSFKWIADYDVWAKFSFGGSFVDGETIVTINEEI